MLETFIPRVRLVRAVVSLLYSPSPSALALSFLGTSVLAGYGWGLFVAIPFSVGMGGRLGVRFSPTASHWRKYRCSGAGKISSWAASSLQQLRTVLPDHGASLLLSCSPCWEDWWATLCNIARVDASTRPPMLALLLFFEPWRHDHGMAFPARSATALCRFVYRSERAAGASVEARRLVRRASATGGNYLSRRRSLPHPRAHRRLGSKRHTYCEFSTAHSSNRSRSGMSPGCCSFPSQRIRARCRSGVHTGMLNPCIWMATWFTARSIPLVALPGGRTLLEGTTWYQHHLWPAGYWRFGRMRSFIGYIFGCYGT